MAREFYQLDEAQRVALLHQRIHQRLLAQKQQQPQMPLLQMQRSQDDSLSITASAHGPLAATSSNSDWWGCDNLLCNCLSKYSVSKTAGKAFAGLCCAGACLAVELAVLAEGAQHHFEEMYHASTCLFNFSLVLILYWLILYRRHKDWLNLIDISVSLLAGGLILGPTILLYNATFAEPDEYLKALTPQPTIQTTTTTTSTTTASPSASTSSSSMRMTYFASTSPTTTNFLSHHPSMLPLSSSSAATAYDHAYAVGFGGEMAYDHHHHHHYQHSNISSLSFHVPPVDPVSSSAPPFLYEEEITTQIPEIDEPIDEVVELTGVNLIGAAGLKCHGTGSFSITHANEIQFCGGMLTAVLCGFAAFLGFIVNAIHVILADTRGEYFLEPQSTKSMNASGSMQNMANRSRLTAASGGAPASPLQRPAAAQQQQLPFQQRNRQNTSKQQNSSSAANTTTSSSLSNLPRRSTSSHHRISLNNLSHRHRHEPLATSPLLANSASISCPMVKPNAEESATVPKDNNDTKFLHPRTAASSAAVTTTNVTVENHHEESSLSASRYSKLDTSQSLRSSVGSGGDENEVDESRSVGESGCHSKLNECFSCASIMSAPTPL